VASTGGIKQFITKKRETIGKIADITVGDVLERAHKGN
jgi:hypothetical protein